MTRTYLAVPFAEKGEAKKLGARWDQDRRAWFTDHITPELKRFLPDSLPPVPAELDPRTEFTAVMQQAGLIVDRDHPRADGNHHRVSTVDDKRGRKSGFYFLHIDGVPNGYVLNHQTGEVVRWCAKMQLSEDQKATLRAQAAEQAERRERALQAQYMKAAQKCYGDLQNLEALAYGDASPYLERKGVVAYPGLRVSRDGQTTHVPMHDIDGRLWSMQTIDAKGKKRFTEGARAKGCFHALGGMRHLDAAARQGVVVLAEGYATAATAAAILEGAPAPVASIATLMGENLRPVAEAIRERYPKARLVIAADNDRSKTVNAGQKHAHATAQAVGAHVVTPPFTPDHPQKLSDWNDLDQYPLPGYDRNTHRRELRQAVADELAHQHNHTQHQSAQPQRAARSHR